MSSSKKTKTNQTQDLALAKVARQLMAHLDQGEVDLGPEAPALTSNDKRRSLKVRKGSERVVQVLADLVKSHDLDSGALHSDAMLERLNVALTLGPLAASLAKMLKRVSDEQYVATGDAWEMALQFYALLRRRATTDGDLAANLEPIASFFAYRHSKVLELKPTKLQTRAQAKLRSAERIISRIKGRAGAPHPAAGTPAPVVVQPPPAVVVEPSVQVPQYPPAGAVKPNGIVNGASNGVVNGASNGAAPST